MLRTPPDIENAECAGAPITFDWDEGISSRFAFDKELNARLAKAANEANYRTNITLAVCVFEWFVRRFEGVLAISDAYQRLEAAYACAINPHYLNSAAFENIQLGNGTDLPPDHVLSVGGYRIWKPLKVCVGAQIGLAGECVNLFLLAHHVMPDPASFGEWLEAAFRKGAETFPREVESYDWQSNFYNYGVEKIVPREFFFDPDFEYGDESAAAVLQQFLDSLDPEANPYLNTPETMTANGYTRTPYKLIDLKKG